MRRKPPVWLRWLVLAYVGLLIGGSSGLVLFRAVSAGIGPIWTALSRPEAVHALQLTLIVTSIAVPCNLVFGVVCALIMVRSRYRLRGVLGPLTSLPLAVSPVVIGLAFLLAYGGRGWLGPTLSSIGLHVIFDVPGMVLATMFVSLPFVVREVEPVLRELGMEQEEAAAVFGASALEAFWHVTLPNIAHAIGYGVGLTVARSVGEFGAVSVVSGHLVGRTQTLTQYVADRYLAFDLTGAYVASALLGGAAMLTLFGMNALRRALASDHEVQDVASVATDGRQVTPPTIADFELDGIRPSRRVASCSVGSASLSREELPFPVVPLHARGQLVQEGSTLFRSEN
jgi:sulfate transport system permease protein